jgi:HD-GYP domain-containing protein (c-di-GMP phosphodiesterase class II)
MHKRLQETFQPGPQVENLVPETLQLHYPVYAPGGQLLLPVGVPLTPQTMADLLHQNRIQRPANRPVLQYGTLGIDLRRFCAQPPYARIFGNQKRTEALLTFMQKIELPVPLLQIIDHFKSADGYTYRHVLVVFALSLLLARELIQDPRRLMIEAQAAPIHDLGKCCVPVSVLTKQTPLDRDDQRILEHHAAAGYVLAAYYMGDPQHPAAVTARDHHERRDGSGYPRGVELDDSIVEIVAVCDVFDALIAQRPYRAVAFDRRTALDYISGLAERGAFRWDIVRLLISCNRKGRPSPTDCIISRTQRGRAPKGNRYSGVIAHEPHPQVDVNETRKSRRA